MHVIFQNFRLSSRPISSSNRSKRNISVANLVHAINCRNIPLCNQTMMTIFFWLLIRRLAFRSRHIIFVVFFSRIFATCTSPPNANMRFFIFIKAVTVISLKRSVSFRKTSYSNLINNFRIKPNSLLLSNNI